MVKFLKKTNYAFMLLFLGACRTVDVAPVDKSSVEDGNKPIVKDEKVEPSSVGNKRGGEFRIYPDTEAVSTLGANKELRLIHGVSSGKGYYQIKNITHDEYLVTIKFSDGSEARREVKAYQLTEKEFFPVTQNITNWTMNQWTTKETLDPATDSVVRFGWRIFRGSKQFRFHNSSDKYIDVSYYFKKDGEGSKRTVKVMPNGGGNWQSYNGGDVIFSFK
jgi:hypothetical protein